MGPSKNPLLYQVMKEKRISLRASREDKEVIIGRVIKNDKYYCYKCQ